MSDTFLPTKLPLRSVDFRTLCQTAKPAPYGKRTNTIVDTSVRDTLEVDASAVKYSDEFDEAIQKAAQQVAQQMQLDADRLQVELYKLLIYPKGGFFLPHRDSEKRRGMVATMIVVLPSSFVGGELIVRHEGRRKDFLFAKARTGMHAQFAGFFADCQHEVVKVTSGVRVCLACNLILKPQRKEPKNATNFSVNPRMLTQVGDWMRLRASDPLVFALEHQYTEAGLKPSLLKGADKELHRQIAGVAQALDCHLHFGQVSRHMSQYADDGSSGYSGRGYKGWAGNCDDLDIGEVYEDEIVIDGWKNATGKPIGFAELRCQTSQLISVSPVEDWVPTRQDYEGYTGNAGNTLDRWYHKSAIVVWPRRQHFEIVADMGLKFATSELLRMRKDLSQLDDDDLEQACDDCQELAESIIRHWPNRGNYRHYGGSIDDQPWLLKFAGELPMFDDPDLVAKFLETLAARDWTLNIDQFVLKSLKRMGEAEILPLLLQLVAFDPTPNQHGIRFLEGLAERDASWLLKVATARSQVAVTSVGVESLFAVAIKKLSDHALGCEENRQSHREWSCSAWQTLCKAIIAWNAVNANPQSQKMLETVFDLPRQHPIHAAGFDCHPTGATI